MYTFTYQKALLRILLSLVFKIVESRQHILKLPDRRDNGFFNIIQTKRFHKTLYKNHCFPEIYHFSSFSLIQMNLLFRLFVIRVYFFRRKLLSVNDI